MRGRKVLGLVLVLALGVTFAAPLTAQAAKKKVTTTVLEDFYATDNQSNLHELQYVQTKTVKKKKKANGQTKKKTKTTTGVEVDSTKAIAGLPAGVSLVGLDQRPKNGDLYAIGSDSRVYRVNAHTGIALTIGDADGFAGAPAAGDTLDGGFFGVDFNPVPDKIRIVSNAGQNIRVNPDNQANPANDGELAGSDMDLGPVPPARSVVHAAYTNSSPSINNPTETTLFVIDSGDNTLYTQAPPNDGTLTTPVPLNVDVSDQGGFDIAGASNTGYLSSVVGSASTLYQVTTASGATQELGNVPGVVLTGLTVDQT